MTNVLLTKWKEDNDVILLEKTDGLELITTVIKIIQYLAFGK